MIFINEDRVDFAEKNILELLQNVYNNMHYNFLQQDTDILDSYVCKTVNIKSCMKHAVDRFKEQFAYLADSGTFDSNIEEEFHKFAKFIVENIKLDADFYYGYLYPIKNGHASGTIFCSNNKCCNYYDCLEDLNHSLISLDEISHVLRFSEDFIYSDEE